jgi:type IV pilus assembly protein PilO
MALEFNEMSKQGQWGVVGVFCAALLGLFYWYYWAPTAQEAQLLEAQIQQIQVENQRTREIADQLPQLEAELEVMEANLGTLQSILPEARETDVLLRRLQSAAADTNLDLQRSDYQPPILHDFYAEVPIRLEVVGSFHDLARFFDRVSKFGRIVTVGQVSITALTDGGPNTIQSQCTASTFYFLPEPEVAEPGAATTTTGG